MRSIVAVFMLTSLGGAARAEDAAPLSALAKMPVREITVFKDGHAFVLNSGKMPTDANGDVQMDYLPTPVLGTFWTYSADKNVKLASVTASQHRVLIDHTALSLREMITANPGVDVIVEDSYGNTLTGQVLTVPTRSSAEAAATEPPNSSEKLPVRSDYFLLKTSNGVRMTSIDNIRAVTFKGAYKTLVGTEDFRNLLTLRLEWPNNRAAKTADVGMVYVQKGVRWIPGYKLTLDGKGSATVKFQATLINELTDLDDVTANLVVGVPYFAFQDDPDPISLQESFAQLSSYFNPNSPTQFALSNAITTQLGTTAYERPPAGTGGFGIPRAAAASLPNGITAEPIPAVAAAVSSEDQFVFAVKHLTLKKGERAVIPVAEYTLKYEDIYTVDMGVTLPRDLLTVGSNADIARYQAAPTALHKLHFTNTGKQPFTTAPVLITENDRVLAESLMPYTAVGADTDLVLTANSDIKIKKTEKETKRTPDAVQQDKLSYGRVDLEGSIALTNYGAKRIRLEVTRDVLGNVDKADNGGVIKMLTVIGGDAQEQQPLTYYGYSWPDWWTRLNGIGRMTWKVDLDPGKTLDLDYTWHYFWRPPLPAKDDAGPKSDVP